MLGEGLHFPALWRVDVNFPFLVCNGLCTGASVVWWRRQFANHSSCVCVCVSSFRSCVPLCVCGAVCVCLVVSCALCLSLVVEMRPRGSHGAAALRCCRCPIMRPCCPQCPQCAMRPRGLVRARSRCTSKKITHSIYLHYAISHSLSIAVRSSFRLGSPPFPPSPPLDLQFARCLERGYQLLANQPEKGKRTI